MLRNVNIHSSEEPEKNPLKRIWEGLVEFAANVLENDEKEQVAAPIPFTGTIDNPKSSILETIVSVLHNAFISAFARSLEGSISVRAVRENLKDVGDPAAEEKGKDKDKKKDKAKAKAETEAPSFGPKRNEAHWSDHAAISLPLGSLKWNRRPPGNEKMSRVSLPPAAVTFRRVSSRSCT
nr:hypothetical protein [Sorangium aterium]